MLEKSNGSYMLSNQVVGTTDRKVEVGNIVNDSLNMCPPRAWANERVMIRAQGLKGDHECVFPCQGRAAVAHGEVARYSRISVCKVSSANRQTPHRHHSRLMAPWHCGKLKPGWA